jgi:uncharacterized protein
MGMQIEKSFVVKASPAAVWDFLLDPHRVARCLPGAAITEQVDGQTYTGTITVKVGPVSASYKGRVRFEHLDAALRSAEIVASGQDIRGKGGADMRLRSRLVEKAPGETEVIATSEVNVTGILAQFGRGMIQDVSDQMFQKFTEAVRAELETKMQAPAAPDPASAVDANQAPPIDAVSFGAGVLGRALGRAVRGPAFWVAAAALALLAYWLW